MRLRVASCGKQGGTKHDIDAIVIEIACKSDMFRMYHVGRYSTEVRYLHINR